MSSARRGYFGPPQSDQRLVTVKEILQEAHAPVEGGCFETCNKACAWLGNLSTGDCTEYIVPTAENIVACNASRPRACKYI